jgi:hypothetical protein
MHTCHEASTQQHSCCARRATGCPNTHSICLAQANPNQHDRYDFMPSAARPLPGRRLSCQSASASAPIQGVFAAANRRVAGTQLECNAAHYAVAKQRPDLVVWLVRHGVNINHPNKVRGRCREWIHSAGETEVMPCHLHRCRSTCSAVGSASGATAASWPSHSPPPQSTPPSVKRHGQQPCREQT